MNKKIIILSGSPRKKDGYRVICDMQLGLKRLADYDFEYIRVADYNIHSCVGCMKCFDKDEQSCPFHDDIKELVEKLINCDAIIFHSPVYAMGVTGDMKRLVDRLSYMFHRPELIAKPAFTVVTTAGGGIKPTQDYLKLVARGFGCNLVGEISIMSPRYYKEYNFYNQRYYDMINRKIVKLINKMHKEITCSNKPSPSYKDIFMFCGLRSKTYFSEADYKFWKEKNWLESDYYYDVKLGCGKRLLSRILNKIVKTMVKRYMKKK